MKASPILPAPIKPMVTSNSATASFLLADRAATAGFSFTFGQ
jgi:hypothetical protein